MKTMLATDIYVVESGTVAGQDVDGNDLIVTDENAVCCGLSMWVTEKVFQEIKSRTAPPENGGDYIEIKEKPVD